MDHCPHLRIVPAAGAAQGEQGPAALRRRTGNAGDRARTITEPKTAVARRAKPGPRAVDRAGGVQGRYVGAHAGHLGAAGGAECARRGRDRRPRLCAGRRQGGVFRRRRRIRQGRRAGACAGRRQRRGMGAARLTRVVSERGQTTLADASLTTLSAAQAAAEIARGAISAEAFTRACLDRIAAIDGQVQAFVHLDPEYAIAQARVLDERRRNGQPIGPLHGVPVGIKDIFDTADFPTECGSPLLKGRRPTCDCAAVARLRAAGAVIIGKTVTTECAYFHPGPTRNPHDHERTPGGSSSGSAAAVAADMVPLAIGSQTNGSVIRPASFCGVYGVKPTHGTISRRGAMILSLALDHVGVFARTLADAALILEVLAGYDEYDVDTRPVAAPHFLKTLAEQPPSPPRLAFVRTPVWEKADAEARVAFEAFAKRLGDIVRPVELPEPFAAAWADHRVIMYTDMAHNLGDMSVYIMTRWSA